jgi:hypothetical protein
VFVDPLRRLRPVLAAFLSETLVTLLCHRVGAQSDIWQICVGVLWTVVTSAVVLAARRGQQRLADLVDHARSPHARTFPRTMDRQVAALALSLACGLVAGIWVGERASTVLEAAVAGKVFVSDGFLVWPLLGGLIALFAGYRLNRLVTGGHNVGAALLVVALLTTLFLAAPIAEAVGQPLVTTPSRFSPDDPSWATWASYLVDRSGKQFNALGTAYFELSFFTLLWLVNPVRLAVLLVRGPAGGTARGQVSEREVRP